VLFVSHVIWVLLCAHHHSVVCALQLPRAHSEANSITDCRVHRVKVCCCWACDKRRFAWAGCCCCQRSAADIIGCMKCVTCEYQLCPSELGRLLEGIQSHLLLCCEFGSMHSHGRCSSFLSWPRAAAVHIMTGFDYLGFCSCRS
jgi:hypothetical protein